MQQRPQLVVVHIEPEGVEYDQELTIGYACIRLDKRIS